MTSRPSANFRAGEIDRVQNYHPRHEVVGPETNAWMPLTVSAKGRGDIAASAHNIAHEGLLQNLGVRPVLDGGQLTDRYSVAINGGGTPP
jgi:hypothetical protein